MMRNRPVVEAGSQENATIRESVSKVTTMLSERALYNVMNN